jgi:hypothetical protein
LNFDAVTLNQHRKTKSKGGEKMRDVRNSDGRLVCRIDEATGTVEIRIKGCVTLIERGPDGKPVIVNLKHDRAM